MNAFWWLSYFGDQQFDEIPGRRLAHRPDRGKRAKVKASRKVIVLMTDCLERHEREEQRWTPST